MRGVRQDVLDEASPVDAPADTLWGATAHLSRVWQELCAQTLPQHAPPAAHGGPTVQVS